MSWPPRLSFPMELLPTEAYHAVSKIYQLARNNGKTDPFDDPIFPDKYLKLLQGVSALTCCTDMTSEEQFAIAVSMSMDKPVKTCRILSNCDFFKNLKWSDVDVELTEVISGHTSWESILGCVKFSFTYVPMPKRVTWGPSVTLDAE